MELSKENLLDYILGKLRNAPKLSQDRIIRAGEPLPYRKSYYIIERYVNDFLSGYKENRFIIMPGLRGIGKTTILFQLYDYLINEKGIDQNRVLYLSVDELNAYFEVKLIDAIDIFIKEIHQSLPVNLDRELFILVDESHYDKNWSLVGKILFDNSEKIFTIFTGSSALNLEMNADAARRAKKEAIYPLDFSEYLILKHGIHPPSQTSEFLMDLIFKGDRESVDQMIKVENELMKITLKLEKSLEKEWEDYLCFGGFPFGPYMDMLEIYERTFNVIEKIIQKDVFLLKSFKSETISTIFNIILFLALQKPGATSHSKLAKSLGVSSSTIKTILNVLEKTHLIFNVMPYGSAGKVVRKSWKYYFLTPSLKAAINFKFGKYTPPSDRNFLGVLAENLVASQFFKMKQITHMPLGIFYSAEKKGVDFLLKDIDGEVIPVEVGIGDKNPSQIKRAINKYGSKHGILVSNARNKVMKEDDVIYVPLTTFSFI